MRDQVVQGRTRLQDQYLQDDLPTRLGRLATNLTRIQSFSHHSGNQVAVERLIEESKLFIEWTASEIDIDSAAELVTMQIQLARWQRTWRSLWADTAQRIKMADQAQVLSFNMLFVRINTLSVTFENSQKLCAASSPSLSLKILELTL